MKYILTTLLSCCAFLLAAQTQDTSESLKIGDWRSYLSFQEGRYVTQSKDKIFFASQYAIATLDKQDNSFDYITKVEGLNDAGVALIRYNSFAKVLIVVYNNSNIDLVYDSGETVNIKDIQSNTDIIGDKQIYDMYMASAKDVYMACGFGVLKLNLERKEFTFTTYMKGKKVKGITVFENNIYAATDKGIYSVKNDEKNTNLADFSQWALLGKSQGLPSTYRSNNIVNYRNRLYMDVNDTLIQYNAGTKSYKKVYTLNNPKYSVKYLTAEGKYLLAGIACDNCNGRLLFINENGDMVADQGNDCIQLVRYAIEDEKGRIWLADEYERFRKMESLWSTCELLPRTNTPYSSDIGEIAIDGKNLWVASGGVNFNGSYATNPNGVYHLENGIWNYYNRTVKNEDVFGKNNVFNCNRIAIHPVNKKVYVASMFRGVVEIDPTTKKTKLYDGANTGKALQYGIGDFGQTRITGLAFDKKNNLWISNNLAEKPIVVLKADGSWAKMGDAIKGSSIYQVAIDNNGFKWFVIGQGDGGIVVYDEGKSIDSEDDDRIITLKTSNANLPSNKINCIEKDLNGQMWIGTDKGVAVFQCSDNVFAEKCKAYVPTVQVDGIADYLLRLENVQCIAIDGANRKWFGTSNGIFVQSPSGRTQVANFNKDNSPLVDNNIIDIAINGETGEIFIGTEKGLQSIKGDALLGKAIHSDVLVYPNPVRPDYDGPIAVKGLARNANVKITDANGTLVLDTQALGGQLIWDGRDYSGRKAAPGVYLVFSTASDTENIDTAVAKILLMR
jgi:ligand-binding sensor domain-containing protein